MKHIDIAAGKLERPVFQAEGLAQQVHLAVAARTGHSFIDFLQHHHVGRVVLEHLHDPQDLLSWAGAPATAAGILFETPGRLFLVIQTCSGIRMAEVFAASYLGSVAWLGTGFAGIVPWLLMMAVLVVKPYGLFGTEEIRRV